MKITKQDLVEMNACSSGLDRFVAQTDDTSEAVDVQSLVGGKNTYSDILWLVDKSVSKERMVRFACDCALINIELIRPYTDKYDLILNFLKRPTAAYAADAYTTTTTTTTTTAADADADAYTAAAAADAAAYAAAYAAAAYAADAAADAADASSSSVKVDKLLIEMINEVTA